MSAWKQTALERLPDCEQLITTYHLNATWFWTEFRLLCEKAITEKKSDLVERIFDFAKWFWRSNSEHLRQAVAFSFFQHLPTSPVLRKEAPHHLSKEDFVELRDVFSWQITAGELATFEAEVLQKSKSQ